MESICEARRAFLKTSVGSIALGASGLLPPVDANGAPEAVRGATVEAPTPIRSSLVRFEPGNAIRSQFFLKPPAKGVGVPRLDVPGGSVYWVNSEEQTLRLPELSNQFVLFQLASDVPKLVEASQVTPRIDGSEKEPDILTHIELSAFHLAENDSVEAKTKATLRIVVNKDPQSSNTTLDTVYWAATAALSLHDKAKRIDARDIRSDITKTAFAKRPIEVPGGLANISFEVIKHNDPSWFRSFLSFFSGNASASLIPILGLPAVSLEVMRLLDDFINGIQDKNAEVLFKSGPMQFAMTQYAKEQFTAGLSTVTVGCLNPGFWILVRGRDIGVLRASPPIYNGMYRRLLPAGASIEDVLQGKAEDPYNNITYAVLRAGMRKTLLSPTFSYA